MVLWACGSCGIGTELAGQHRRWHKDGEPVLFRATGREPASRCRSCQTLVLHLEVHAAWHVRRGDNKPTFERTPLKA